MVIPAIKIYSKAQLNFDYSSFKVKSCSSSFSFSKRYAVSTYFISEAAKLRKFICFCSSVVDLFTTSRSGA